MVLAGSPRPKTVGFHDLVGVAIAPVSKKLAVKLVFGLKSNTIFTWQEMISNQYTQFIFYQIYNTVCQETALMMRQKEDVLA